MISINSLPDHFFTRELFVLPLETGHESLIGTGTLQHRDRTSLRTIDYQSTDYSGVLLLRGKGYYEDKNGTVIPLKRGSFFQRFPGITHSTYPDREGLWSEFYINLPAPLSDALARTGFIDGKTPVKGVLIDEELINTVISIKEFFRNDKQIEAAAILPRIMDFLYLLRRPESGKDAPEAPVTGEERFMQLFHNRLRSHASYALDVKELCRDQGVGYESFRKRFREKNGIPPGLYAARYRIDEACRRMRDSQMPIKEIAFDLGYPDLATFSRQFARIKGASPRQWHTDQKGYDLKYGTGKTKIAY